MKTPLTTQAWLLHYRTLVAQFAWTSLHEFQLVWSPQLGIHMLLRKGATRNTGILLGITHERRRFRTTILVFHTILSDLEDIFYNDADDETTVLVEFATLLMKMYDLPAPQARALGHFSWTERDAFEPILRQVNDVITTYALPWLASYQEA